MIVPFGESHVVFAPLPWNRVATTDTAHRCDSEQVGTVGKRASAALKWMIFRLPEFVTSM